MSVSAKLAQERRARLAAERMLELKQSELWDANRKLGQHALNLTRRIDETEAAAEAVRSENKKVKSELIDANRKIQVAERRLWHSIQTIEDGFAVFDAHNLMVGANTAYLRAFDGLEEVVPGISYTRILELMAEEGIVDTEGASRHAWCNMMVARLHANTPQPQIIRLWNNQYIKLIDKRGTDGDMVSLALNITATVQHEADMNDARLRAEQASRAKSAFLANMSHELRTPMNGMMSMADLLSESDLTEEQRLYASTIRNSGEALLVIINDVLDYSKIEAGKMTLRPEPFDLERGVHDVVMMLQPSVREKGLSLMVDFDLFFPTRFVGDAGRIRQILTNLVGNAIKFTDTGHVLIRITGVPDEAAQTCDIHVAIEDTGIGIPASKIDHIFGKFNQVEEDRNRSFEGTGLGLAITKQLVELMGGTIWAESTYGEGACFGFRLTLPAADSNAPTQAPEGLNRVLIVEGQDLMRDILTRQLASMGITSQSCRSGEMALELGLEEFDMVLTSHNLEGMTGLDLAARLKGVPVVVLSSNPAQLRNSEASKYAAGILQEPLPRVDLLVHLTRIWTKDSPIAGAASAVPETPAEARMRVLAAEDNRTNQLVLRKMIDPVAVDLRFADNGVEAVALFQSFAPDLILMDISMPKMDGKEATRHIRAHETQTGGHVPIVALTAHALAGDEDEILKAGLDHYLTKPLKKAQITALINQYQPPSLRRNTGESGSDRSG